MENQLQVNFGNVLRLHRENKGWSQMKLAMEANLHLNALGKIERGEQNPTLHTIQLLSNALGIKMSQLIAEVEDR